MKSFCKKTVVFAVIAAVSIGISGSYAYAMDETGENVEADMLAGEAPEGDVMQEGESIGDAPADYAAEGDTAGEMATGGIQSPEGLIVNTAFPEELLPLSFHKATASYMGQQIETAQFDNGTVTVVYVSDADGSNPNYKVLDEATGALTDFRMVAGPNDKFIIVLNPSDDIIPPAGFEKAILDWKGQTLSAFINTTAQPAEGADAVPSEYFLLYAQSSDGRTGWYLYDQTESTYQRYVGIGNSAQNDEEDLLNIEAVKEGDNTALVRLIIIAALSLIVIILVVVVIILALKLKEYGEYEYIDEDDYNAATANERNDHIYNVMSEGVVDDGEPPVRENQVPERENQVPERDNTASARAAEVPARKTETSVRRTENPTSNSRQAILETGDIADLDDILNDPDATSELPLPTQIEIAARAASASPQATAATSAPVKQEAAPAEQIAVPVKSPVSDDTSAFANMQVTVDRFQAGMPAMVDTEAIAEGAQDYAEQMRRTNSGRIVYDYPQEPYDPEDDEDWDYISKEERKERKAIYKEQMREYKEALKDLKYMEKEQRKAEKRKNKGYAEPEAMDWGSFQSSIQDSAADSRRPRGNNQDALPSYVKSDMTGANAPMQSANAQMQSANVQAQNSDEQMQRANAVEKPAMSEDEKALEAANAVIRAARGAGHTNDIPTADEVDNELSYREYRQGARNLYEEYRQQDAQNMNAVERQPAPAEPVMKNPQFTQDLDEDFEFEFLNIRNS